MEAKIEKISELSKLLSVKTRMSDDFFHLFGKFGIGHLLSRLSLEKQDGVSASELILSLCLFRIVGESIPVDANIRYMSFQIMVRTVSIDTVLEKSGVRMEGISRVFDPMKGRCVLGYKLLLCAFFDGKTRMVR